MRILSKKRYWWIDKPISQGGFILNTVKKLSGVALAAAATLFVAGCATQDTVFAAKGNVKFTGINGCKGLSDCKTASNARKGQNS